MASNQPNPVKLLIAYGTSTGTAFEVSKRIAREAYSFTMDDNPAQRFFSPKVVSMKDLTAKYLAENWEGENYKVIFVLATTGQGAFPDDTKAFWKDLMGKSSESKLAVRYAVIGLGDSSYELYNYPGKKLYRRLEQMGAKPEFDICLCDDQHDLGYVGALNPFLEICWSTWVPTGSKVSRASTNLASSYTILDYMDCSGKYRDHDFTRIKNGMSKVVRIPIVKNERVTAIDHYQDTRLIEFDTQKTDLKFEAGDALQIFPENMQENVDLFFKIFPHLKADDFFILVRDPDMTWEKIPPELHWVVGPQPWCWSDVATRLLDLQSIPGSYAFEILRHFVTDPLVKEKFEEMCRPEGLEELYNYVNRPRRTVLEVLQDFPCAVENLPMDFIFDIIPFMRPRAFSIASPPKENHHIEILMAVVEYKTNLKKPRRGTCSYWLARDGYPGLQVPVFIEKGSLKAPLTECHMLMIGPGTGVAPFRSMIKQHEGSFDKHLVFGCRGKDRDYYFGKEFEEMSERGVLTFNTAISRDKLNRKVDYVQDVILRQEPLIRSMLASPLPLYIYVCGRSGDMPKDVWKAFKSILEKLGVPEPEKFLTSMLNSGQYQTETY